jgi:RimJ/RimL family protein N-acetyltransferase
VEGPAVSAVAALPSISLRLYRPSDADAFAQFRRDPTSTALAFGSVQVPQPAEVVQQMADGLMARGDLIWMWVDDADTPVGFSLLTSVDWLNRTLATGSGVFSTAQRGRGLGTLGRRLALDHVFNEMGFRRAYGEFAAYNEASRRSHAKLGVEVVGARRQVFHVSGAYYDAIVYMVRRERFNELFPPDPNRYLGRRA